MIHEEARDLRCFCGQVYMRKETNAALDGHFVRVEFSYNGSITHSVYQCFVTAVTYLEKGSRSAEERLD